MIIEKESLFFITHGGHGEYEVLKLCKAIADIDVMALKSEYLGIYPDQEDIPDRGRFIEWLKEKRVCVELSYFEWYLGEHGYANFWVTPPRENK